MQRAALEAGKIVDAQDAANIAFAGATKAAELMQTSGMKAVKIEQMSQVITTRSWDMARRSELTLTIRY